MDDHKPSSLPTQPTQDYRTAALLTYALTLTLIFLATLSAKTFTLPIQAQENPAVSPSASPSATPSITPTPSLEPTDTPVQRASENPLAQKEKIIGYIEIIFGPNAKTASAIALAESGRSYKGTRVFNPNAMHVSDFECSVGLFQINLRNREAKVHWARVPGQTETEKIDWLKNPYNNTLFAYWIFSTSGFHPWSVYADGSYLAHWR